MPGPMKSDIQTLARRRAERISADLWDRLAGSRDFAKTAPATFKALRDECDAVLAELSKDRVA